MVVHDVDKISPVDLYDAIEVYKTLPNLTKLEAMWRKLILTTFSWPLSSLFAVKSELTRPISSPLCSSFRLLFPLCAARKLGSALDALSQRRLEYEAVGLLIKVCRFSPSQPIVMTNAMKTYYKDIIAWASWVKAIEDAKREEAETRAAQQTVSICLTLAPFSSMPLGPSMVG